MGIHRQGFEIDTVTWFTGRDVITLAMTSVKGTACGDVTREPSCGWLVLERRRSIGCRIIESIDA